LLNKHFRFSDLSFCRVV